MKLINKLITDNIFMKFSCFYGWKFKSLLKTDTEVQWMLKCYSEALEPYEKILVSVVDKILKDQKYVEDPPTLPQIVNMCKIELKREPQQLKENDRKEDMIKEINQTKYLVNLYEQEDNDYSRFQAKILRQTINALNKKMNQLN